MSLFAHAPLEFLALQPPSAPRPQVLQVDFRSLDWRGELYESLPEIGGRAPTLQRKSSGLFYHMLPQSTWETLGHPISNLVLSPPGLAPSPLTAPQGLGVGGGGLAREPAGGHAVGADDAERGAGAGGDQQPPHRRHALPHALPVRRGR